jgi:acyl-coenzyme A synthetase/AMP-(fatty) acid ligase
MTETLDQLARRALDRAGEEIVIEYGSETYDRAWTRRIAGDLETLLAAAQPRRDGLGFVARNRPACAAALLGMVAAGRSITMIYAFQSPEALAQTVRRLGLQALVMAEEDLSEPVLEAAAGEGIAVVALGDGVRLVAPGDSSAELRIEEDAEPCVRLLTSGTTGQPKHYPMTFSVIAGFASDGAAGIKLIDSGVPALAYYPLANISGLMTTLPPLLAGRSIVLQDRFDPRRWADFIARFRPSRGSLPPAGFGMILDAGIPPKDLASIALVTTGNSALDPAVQEAFEQRYGVKVLTAYGATEFAGTAAAMTEALYDEWYARKRGTVGRACSGVAMRVSDVESGAILGPGEEGVMEVQVARLGPKWIRTTDLGIIDEDGFVFLRGRSDGAFSRGGFKILPEAIERALIAHPDVAAAVVVGIPDARLGKVPAALVQPISLETRPDPEALKAHVRNQLPSPHVPTGIWVVDQLPRTPSLKLDRATARALIEAKMTQAKAAGRAE